MSGCHDEGREKLYVGGGDLGRPREGLRANCRVSERERKEANQDLLGRWQSKS